jgi:pimeloyl-ACP methyl ester carboxylesterase
MTTGTQAQDKWVVVRGLQFHYREWGYAHAPPLLILHGLTGHAWEFDRVAAALADRFHVLAVNQRGHGASAWAEEYAPAVMADDIAALSDTLQLDRVRIIGHSMGGVNSWLFAARHPERVERLAIIDVDPESITSEALVSVIVAVLHTYAQARYADPEEAVTQYLAEYTGPCRQQLRAFVMNNLKVTSDGAWTWRFDARGLVRWVEDASGSAEAHWSALRLLTCPTLVVRAGDSPFTKTSGAEDMRRNIPQARLVEIPGAGHDIHIDQFDALLAALWPFLIGSEGRVT